MSQIVTVDRYCAIEDTHCHKTLEFNGPWTFFFAYPSNPGVQSFSRELVEELNSRGIVGVRWEDMTSNDLLFAKVCEGIYANDFLLAEVTEPNANVMLEIGYALCCWETAASTPEPEPENMGPPSAYHTGELLLCDARRNLHSHRKMASTVHRTP